MHTVDSGIQGHYRDRVMRDQQVLADYGWRSNIIVTRCRQLLAAFLMGDSDVDPGIQFIQFGRGDASWDAAPLPPPNPNTQQLVDTQAVKIDVGDMALSYLDDAGNEIATVHHRMQATVEVPQGLLNVVTGGLDYPLREFGLFGGYNGNDYMIDYVRHPVIHIKPQDELLRRIRLVF